ncbi:MAG: hypothetical protein IKW13_00040 [Thermoguttaceae bacterium]|nr:hypothetical protein [Thermoguttaceae bacterium]
MKINRNFWKRVAQTAAVAAVAFIGAVGENALKAQDGEVKRLGQIEKAGQTAETKKIAETAQNGEIASTAPSDAWVADGFPLIYRRDGAALEAIWNALEPSGTGQTGQVEQMEQTGKAGASEPFADAVDFQLRRQGPKYKGKTLALRGRLLRAVWVPAAGIAQNSETAQNGEVAQVNETAQNGEVAQVNETAQNGEVARVDETAQNGEVAANGENRKGAVSGGFYDLWVLLPDSKRDPVRLLTRRAPPGFNVDERLENATAYPETVEYRRETVEATAVYYRTTAFDGGDDFYAAPTLVAVDFRWSGAANAASGGGADGKTGEIEKTGDWLGVKIVGVAVIVAVWLWARRKSGGKLGKRGKQGKRGESAFDLPDSIEPFALFLVAAGAFVGAIRAETPEVGGNAGTAQVGENGEISENAQDVEDAAFWSVATGVDVDAWRRETNPNGLRPALDSSEAVERRRIAVATFERLARLVSPSVLAERFGESEEGQNNENGQDGENRRPALVGTLGDYVATAPRERPATDAAASVCYFCGTALRVERLATGADEAARIGAPALYRVVVALDSPEDRGDGANSENSETSAASETLVVYSPNVPNFAAPSSFFDANAKRGGIEKAGRTGKGGRNGDLAKKGELGSVGVGERVGGLGVLFGRETDGAVALAARVGWFPTDAPLGRLGVDLSAFEGALVYPIRALTAEKDPTRRREIARTLRWTSADVRPFYETLAAVRRDSRSNGKSILTPDSRFASETEKIAALFNRPEENQGRVATLRGRVRRANLILVDDPDVVAATGIDRYYQLYLFANDSQGWPLVLCVPELPDDLKVGGGKEYRREIEFVGAFTKVWAYKTSAQKTQNAETAQPLQDAETSQSAQSAESTGPGPWGRVPVLVGRVVNVVPEEPERPKAPLSPTASVVGFALLAVAWVALRRRAARPPREK